MKKIYLSALVCLFFTTNYAQDINDALRYAQSDLNGTARFRAMGGAFGAVGGDLSAINVNPAGSAIFNNNLVGVTLTNYNVANKSNFYGTKTSSDNNSFDLNQGGAVFIFKNENENSGWKKLSLSANYDNSRNLDNSLYSAGINQNSVANYFTSYANGLPLGIVSGNQFGYESMYFNEQQAYLGYESYVIESTNINDNNTTSYYSNVAPGGNYYQDMTTETSGYNSKLSFNAAGQYGEKLYVGINLNSHFTDLRKSTSFFESNNNTTANVAINRLRFNNELYTYGQGFSFQLGTIYKATKELRVGLAYESPTWYKLNDELSQSIVTVRSSTAGDLAPSVLNPQITNIFEPYRLQTPGKYTGSLAYVFGKRGLLSVDYSMKDYSNTKYRPNNDFSATNAVMSKLLDTSNEIRIGGEYKIERFSLRGGYRWEESPYKNKKTIGDLTGYSGGLGYNFGDTKVDLSYSYAKRFYDNAFFTQGLTDYARIESVTSNVSLTVLFEL